MKDNYIGLVLQNSVWEDKYIYILDKCRKTPYYYISFGSYTEEGKLMVYCADVIKLNDYYFVDTISQNIKIKKQEKERFNLQLRRGLITETLTLSHNNWEMQNFVENLEIEIMEEYDERDFIESITLASNYVLVLGKKNVPQLKLSKSWFVCNFFGKVMTQNHNCEKAMERSLEFFQIAYRICRDLRDYRQDEFVDKTDFLIPLMEEWLKKQKKEEHMYEWYAVQTMKLLLEYKDSLKADVKKEICKELIKSFLHYEKNTTFEEPGVYVEINFWTEFDKKKIQDEIVQLMMTEEMEDLTDEIVFQYVFRYIFYMDMNSDVERWINFFHVKPNDRLFMTGLLFRIEKSRFLCNFGKYDEAEQEVEVIYDELLEQWETLCESVDDTTCMHQLGNSVINTLYEIGEYKKINQFYGKYRSVPSKRMISNSRELDFQIMQLNNDEFLERYGLKDCNVLMEVYHKSELQKLTCENCDNHTMRMLLNLIRINEMAELIERKLAIADIEVLNKVGYYVGRNSFQFVLDDAKHHMKIMNACYMNDADEGYVLSEYLSLQRNRKQNAGIYLKSFSLVGESVMMWNLYGEGGEGYYINVEPEFFENLQKKDSNFKLYRMVYVSDVNEFKVAGMSDERLSEKIKEKCIKLKKYISDVNNDIDKFGEKERDAILDYMNHSLRLLRYLFKRDIFESEQEVRILYEDNDTYDVRTLGGQALRAIDAPVPLVISGIILGPSFKEGMKSVPAIAYKACEMRGKNIEKQKFLREGIAYSKFGGKVIEFKR